MNINWTGVWAAIVSIIAFFATYRVSYRQTKRVRCWSVVLAFLLAIPGISFAFYYLHLVPDAAWYFEFRSLPGTEWLTLFVGVFFGYLARIAPRYARSVALAGAVGVSIAPSVKPFIGPLDASSLENRWRDGVCLQSSPSTCGPASMATVLAQLGWSVSENELAASSYSYAGGTEAWYLARAARKRGAEVEFRTGVSIRTYTEWPAIAGVRFGEAGGHFIAILGETTDGRFVVGDPLFGQDTMTLGQLMDQYVFSGMFIRVR